MEKSKRANEIIDALGGTKKVAILCDALETSVSMWRIRGIPKTQLRWMRIKRPKIFKQLGIDGDC